MTQNKCVLELLESLVCEWDIVLTHVNIKYIQNFQFQADLESRNIHILQMDFGMNYSCKYQKEIQSV